MRVFHATSQQWAHSICATGIDVTMNEQKPQDFYYRAQQYYKQPALIIFAVKEEKLHEYTSTLDYVPQ